MLAANILLCKLLPLILFGSANLILTNGQSSPNWLKNLVPLNYSSDLPPIGNGTGTSIEPAVVYCVLKPVYVTSLSMKTMDFDVDIQISVEWNDFRLNYNGHEDLITNSIDIPIKTASKMWQPSLVFENTKGSEKAFVTSNVVKIAPLWTEAALVNKVGVYIYYRKTFCFSCHFDFVAYPFDVQRCEIVVRWVSGINPYYPVLLKLQTVHEPEKVVVPPGFRLSSLKIIKGNNKTVSAPTGKFLLINQPIRFTFERIYAQHMMLIFLPSVLIVMLSWVSFWLDVRSAAPRVALGLTTLLTLCTQFNAAQRDLPPVADIKALDIWMFTCMFMVFASLVEFALADICQRVHPATLQKVSPLLHHSYTHTTVHNENQIKPKEKFRTPKFANKMKTISLRYYRALRPHETTSKIDYIARILFPVSFLTFSLAFWQHFLVNHSE